MKTSVLALVALSLSIGAASAADTGIPTRLALAPLPTSVTAPVHQANGIPTVPKLSLAPLPGTRAAASSLPSNPADFAQLSGENHQMPISSGMVLGLVAVFVLALRLMGVQHARAMADHERDAYHGKTQMFHALQNEQSGR